MTAKKYQHNQGDFSTVVNIPLYKLLLIKVFHNSMKDLNVL